MTWSEILALLPVSALLLRDDHRAKRGDLARAFAIRYHESVDEDADILGLSAANAAAGLSGAFVVNGSPTQTAMADRVGARSQIAQLALAGVVLLVLLLAERPARSTCPRCVLAAIVFTSRSA